MNTTDLIQSILSEDVKGISIGRVPEEDGTLFVNVDQVVRTGDGKANFTTFRHQRTGKSLVDCLEAVRRDMLYCQGMQNHIGVVSLHKKATN